MHEIGAALGPGDTTSIIIHIILMACRGKGCQYPVRSYIYKNIVTNFVRWCGGGGWS